LSTEPLSAVNSPRKSSLLIVFLVVFIDLLGFGIVLPLLPRYGDYYGASRWMLGALMAAFSAMQFLFAPVWGRISDQIGRRPVLMLGLAGSVLFYALFGFASAFEPSQRLLGLGAIGWMMIARIGAGVAGATIPTAQAYIADSTGAKERGKGMALIGAAFGLGFTFGPLLAATFASDDPAAPPSTAPGYVASALSAMAFLAAIFLLPESLRPGSAPAGRRWFSPGALASAFRRPVLAQLLSTIFLTTFAFAEFESTLSLLTDELGMSDQDNFYVFAYLGLILTLAQGFLVRRLLPRIGERRSALIGAVLMTVGLLLIGFTSGGAAAEDSTARHQASHASMLFGVLPISIIGFAMVTPALHSLVSLTSSESEQGEILGLGQSMSAMARILGPVAGIALIKSDPRYPYWSSAAIMVVGIVLVSLLHRAPQAHAEPLPAGSTD
jgi:MFS family permease